LIHIHIYIYMRSVKIPDTFAQHRQHICILQCFALLFGKLRWVAMHCSVLQCIATRWNTTPSGQTMYKSKYCNTLNLFRNLWQCATVCCCYVLECVALCPKDTTYHSIGIAWYRSECCITLYVYSSVLQCVLVCCSVLQYITLRCNTMTHHTIGVDYT